ncbi:Short-chain dehydrogenase TIC 32, chloroplastic, partial [Quercus suber]
MWIFSWKGPSGFSASSTAEEVTQGIDGTGLTAIVTETEFVIVSLSVCLFLAKQKMWIFSWKGPSGFSASSTAEEVTQGIDGTGLTAIVTGASSGLGVETTRVLTLRGVHVIMAVRNTDAGKNVKEQILKEIPNAKIDVMELDLSSMGSVRKFASDYNASGLPLNLLIWKGPSGFSASSTAEEVTQGIDGTGLTAIVTEFSDLMKPCKYMTHDNSHIYLNSGASSGLGVETTRVLTLRGVHVIMAVRNTDAGKNVKEQI